jgi:aerobic carbon-monoxide dehydrogenase medium subunit
MGAFVYRRPQAVDEVLELLGDGDPDVKILAGGQSLIPAISLGLAQPRVLLDINRIPELDYARIEAGEVVIGPLVRHSQLEKPDPELRRAAPLFPLAAELIGHAAIRNRGTFLGSIAHGDPSAEWPAITVALDATLRLRNRRGERTVSARDFFVGPLTTAFEADEMLCEARLPRASGRTGAAVKELTYRHGDYAVVGVVAQLVLDKHQEIASASVTLFSVGPTPARASDAEKLLIGGGPERFEAAADSARAAADPVSDSTASAQYHREMVGIMVQRALAEAFEHARTADSPL